MVENGENILLGLGFKNVRVRRRGDTALIELCPEDFRNALESPLRSTIVHKFKSIGYTYVTLDLEGFHSENMDEIIMKEEE